MNEAKKNIQEEYEKFETYYKGVERHYKYRTNTTYIESVFWTED